MAADKSLETLEVVPAPQRDSIESPDRTPETTKSLRKSPPPDQTGPLAIKEHQFSEKAANSQLKASFGASIESKRPETQVGV